MASKTLRELTIKLDADVAELKKGLAKADKRLTGFQKRMKGIGASFKNILPVLAVGAVVNQVGQLVGEMSMLGKELEGVKQGFQGIDPQVLKDMRKSTRGTVTDLDLMKQAVQFKNFGLPVEQLGTMLDFVHRRARTSGQSVKFLADSLVTGLGRKSAMIIDNLGISTAQLNAELKKTPDFTEAVANIMKRDMQASGEYIETAADITERWSAQWQNTKANVGLLLNKGIKLIAPVIDDLKKNMGEMFSEVSKNIIEFINEWITLYNESIRFRASIAGIGLVFTALWESVKLVVNLIIDALKGAGKTIAFIFNPKNWGKGFAKGLADILVNSVVEAKDDIVKAGENIADALIRAEESTLIGQRDLITNALFSTEAVEGMTQQASDAGTKTGKSFMEGFQKKMSLFAKSMKTIVGGGEDASTLIDDAGMDAAADETIENVKAVSKKVQLEMSSINNFLADSFVQLGTNIGNSLSGMGSIFDGFLNIIIDFAAQFGKILVGLGIATISLKSLGINPVAAIIAGTAIIALSKLAKNMLSSGPGFAGGGIVPGSSFSGDNVPINTNSGELILNRAQQGNVASQLSGGRGGKLVAVVSGSDLKFILDEANRMDNNSF